MSSTDTTKALEISSGFVTGLFGLYCWEVAITSWHCEIDVLRGKRPWRWTTSIYVASRVSLFVVLLLTVTGTEVLGVNSTPRCQAFISTWQVAEALAIALVTLMLMLRVFAVYRMSWKIIVPFGVLNVGQLAVCMLTIITMEWRDRRCLTVHIAARTPGFIAAKYIYSLALDSVVLAAALIKLWPMRRTASPSHPLTKLLMRDGILFYFIAVAANAVQIGIIFTVMRHHGPTTRVTAQNFSTVVSAVRVIAACRLYISLSDFLSPRLADPSVICDCMVRERGAPVSSEFFVPQRSLQCGTDPISISVDVVVEHDDAKTPDAATEMKVLRSKSDVDTYRLQFMHPRDTVSYV